MDVFAHFGYGGIFATRGGKKRNRFWKVFLLGGLFGVLPDLIAFVPGYVLVIFGGYPFLEWHHTVDTVFYDVSHTLYQFSHSLVIFAIVLILFAGVKKMRSGKFQVPLWFFAWPLHIFIDLPLHAKDFYATPVFFPLSDWKFLYGVHWSNPNIMATYWAALLLMLGIVFYRRRVYKLDQ